MTDISLRPPAVPLVVNDPYLSVWSTHDTLTGQWSKHWTGTKQAMSGLIRIDGSPYRFLGMMTRHYGVDVPEMAQTSLDVLPTRTIYTFEAAGVRLTLTFTSPLMPHDLEIMSRPVTYVDMSVESLDSGAHDVALYFDITAEWAVNTSEQRVVWGRHVLAGREVLWIGSTEQDVLGKSGDDLRIDWGYLYTVAGGDHPSSHVLGRDTDTRALFAQTGKLPHSDSTDIPRPVHNRPPVPVAARVFDLGSVDQQPEARQIVIAYDDQFSLEYMYRKLRPYWRRNGMDAAGLIETAVSEYPNIKARCEQYDTALMDDLRNAGGEAYARLAALAFRQCMAAHKLVADHDGTLLFFSKENFSNGCMGTVDITYPSSPFFLLFNPDLLQAQLTPILDYAASPRWPFVYAPHDIGRYPLANGQVYGGGEESDLNQMPVEESGNMLLLVAALVNTKGNTAYADRYWDLLAQWAGYLVENGLDPENQLCTDDFAGHLAHNVNLSLKAIVAVAAFAQLAQQCGHKSEANDYRAHAERMAQEWQRMAATGDHYRLTFDNPNSWSQKYNLVWDTLLELDLFPAEVAQKEVAYYKTRLQRYGLPLDNRSAYTKLDWTVWSASLSNTPGDFEAFLAPVYRWLNETESRVPLTDWYYTDSGKQAGFQARAVVGGVFIKLLYDADTWQKWRDNVRLG